MKRKLNIKEIFNIGQKKSRKPNIEKKIVKTEPRKPRILKKRREKVVKLKLESEVKTEIKTDLPSEYCFISILSLFLSFCWFLIINLIVGALASIIGTIAQEELPPLEETQKEKVEQVPEKKADEVQKEKEEQVEEEKAELVQEEKAELVQEEKTEQVQEEKAGQVQEEKLEPVQEEIGEHVLEDSKAELEEQGSSQATNKEVSVLELEEYSTTIDNDDLIQLEDLRGELDPVSDDWVS